MSDKAEELASELAEVAMSSLSPKEVMVGSDAAHGRLTEKFAALLRQHLGDSREHQQLKDALKYVVESFDPISKFLDELQEGREYGGEPEYYESEADPIYKGTRDMEHHILGTLIGLDTQYPLAAMAIGREEQVTIVNDQAGVSGGLTNR